MEVKPGYRQTEMGMIPEDWTISSVHKLCSKIQDGTHFSPKPGGNDYLYITSKNIRYGYLDVSSASRISESEHRLIYRRCDVKKGDLLLTKDGANTGNAALNTLEEEFSLLSSVAFLRFPEERYTTQYFLQQILGPASQRQIQDAMSGNAITRLTLNKIKNLRFPLPATKTEQEAIATALSDADALIESVEQLIAKKRKIKQGAMQELLTGKKRLPGFSQVWGAKQISQFAACTAGGTPSTRVPQYWGGMIRWMNSGELNLKMVNEVEGRITDEGLKNSSTKVIPTNCVLVGLAGQGKTRGTVAMNLVPLCTNQSIAAIFPDTRYVSQYLYYNLDSRYDELRELSSGEGGRGGLNLKIIGQITVPFPCLEEQKAISDIFSDIDDDIWLLEAKLAKGVKIKQGMMQELLTGRIRLV